MKNIDYKIFVPRGENNYVRLDKEEFEITDILTVNIHLGDDKVTYWLYFKIPLNDEHHNVFVKPGKKPKMILLIGNNPYEIHGEAEVLANYIQKWEQKRQISVSFTVTNASNTTENPRSEVKYERSELLDLRREE